MGKFTRFEVVVAMALAGCAFLGQMAPGAADDKTIMDETGVRTIENTHDPLWKEFPDIKTKVIFDGKIFYMNYEEYWHEFLLVDLYPNANLMINVYGLPEDKR